jgi:hypothetical protein
MITTSSLVQATSYAKDIKPDSPATMPINLKSDARYILISSSTIFSGLTFLFLVFVSEILAREISL